jgi:hypothetical protein
MIQIQLKVLPYFKLKANFMWNYNFSNASATPIFHITDGTFCLGHVLGKMMNSFAAKAKFILDPLQPILGPNGILMMKKYQL